MNAFLLTAILALTISQSCFGFNLHNSVKRTRLQSVATTMFKTDAKYKYDDSIVRSNDLNLNVMKQVTSPIYDDDSELTGMKSFDGNAISMEAGAFLLAAAASVFLFPLDASAKDGAYGILEGRTASMLHPVTMLLLFVTSVYSGSLGLKWRQLRNIGEEIKGLNKQLPVISSGKLSSPLSEAADKIKAELAILVGSEDNDAPLRASTLTKDLSLIQGAAVLDSRIIELSQTRKSLQSANLKDKHWLTGSVLLGVGVSVSILGAFNTYMRSGKLFPGPHLYAGMGITMLWAAAAALVPEMQKGNEAARIGHIVLNTANVALFAWQVVTGFDIMIKVWGFTHWP